MFKQAVTWQKGPCSQVVYCSFTHDLKFIIVKLATLRGMMRLVFFLLLYSTFSAFGQTSSFQTNDDGWTAIGDPTSTIPAWWAMGGNPDGHIRVADASTGGTWYFLAPPAFQGQKCDAYGKYLRYDELTSDTSGQQQYGGKPDVVLLGGGLQLVFDNADNPGLDWTHYDIPLQEDAGWRLNSLTGPLPTQAQFKAVLSNVTGLRIRGEYRAQEDEGGLDNVVLESTFHFDLDGDDSSGALNADFLADTSCTAQGMLADQDAVLQSETHIDSIIIRVLNAMPEDELRLDVLLGNVIVQQTSPDRIVFINDGTTLPADFLQLLHLLAYYDNALLPLRGTRQIDIQVYAGCGLAGKALARLPVYPPPIAGQDADTLLCAQGAALDLRPLLGPAAELGGSWWPDLPGSAGRFDPNLDKAGIYHYVFPSAGVCPGDTASVLVTIEQPFQLPGDTTMCFDAVLLVTVPQDLVVWDWSTGSQQEVLVIDKPGMYTLTGRTANCLFSDSIAVAFYTCSPCPFYAPNVFSPNDDGRNDEWTIQLACQPLDFHLQVFDRWGSLVFASSEGQKNWDGRFSGKDALPGVYIWQVDWLSELFGEVQRSRQQGNVTVIR